MVPAAQETFGVAWRLMKGLKTRGIASSVYDEGKAMFIERHGNGVMRGGDKNVRGRSGMNGVTRFTEA